MKEKLFQFRPAKQELYCDRCEALILKYDLYARNGTRGEIVCCACFDSAGKKKTKRRAK